MNLHEQNIFVNKDGSRQGMGIRTRFHVNRGEIQAWNYCSHFNSVYITSLSPTRTHVNARANV